MLRRWDRHQLIRDDPHHKCERSCVCRTAETPSYPFLGFRFSLVLDFCWETSSLSGPISEREPDTDATAEKGSSQAATGNREVVLQRTATRVAQIVGHITMQCIPYDFTTTHRGVRRPDETWRRPYFHRTHFSNRLSRRKSIGRSVVPTVARSASASPTTLENLNPWPLNPQANQTRFFCGCRSMMKCESGLFE